MSDSIDLDNFSNHSLNCGSDFKEAHCIQQQSVAKLSRSDLEDLYYQLHDENLEVKKKFNNLDSKYKIMATRVMRLSRDHKCMDSIDREEDQRQLQQLRQNEAALRAKLTVLRGQLASHTRLHSAALSKVQRPKTHRCSRSCHAGSCGGEEELLLDIGNSGGCQSRSQSRHRSTSRSTSQQRGVGGSRGTGSGPVTSKNQNELVRANTALREEVAQLEDRFSTLQKEMSAANEQSRKRILHLEAELGTQLAQETAENIELIKARRMNKQQEAALISLQREHQQVQRELQACKTALTLAAQDQDEMCSTLMRERQRCTELQQDIVKLSQTCSSMRELEEQLNDAKKENAVLKEHSNRLLQLTTGLSDTRTSPRRDTSEVKRISSHISNQDQSVITAENSVMEQKLETLKLQKSHLQQELKEAQSEIAALRRKIIDAKEEQNALKEEHVKVQSENSKLQIELAVPNEERRRLVQQLADVRSECSSLTEELSKCKSDLEQKHQQHQELKKAYQDLNSSSVNKEQATDKDRAALPPYAVPESPAALLPSHPMFLSPQLSSRPGHYVAAQSRSHPSTPRPRVGDACLALLEQTAIRPVSVPFPGVLAGHGSLQERFLELCIPPSSLSSSSTPIPPGTIEGSTAKIVSSVTYSSSEDVQQVSNTAAEYSPKPRLGFRTNQSNADTQWELEKCRELLRVQFNLNSFYKKEVASLSNLVQSLTTGSQDSNK